AAMLAAASYRGAEFDTEAVGFAGGISDTDSASMVLADGFEFGGVACGLQQQVAFGAQRCIATGRQVGADEMDVGVLAGAVSDEADVTPGGDDRAHGMGGRAVAHAAALGGTQAELDADAAHFGKRRGVFEAAGGLHGIIGV